MYRFQFIPYKPLRSFWGILFTLAVTVFLGVDSIWIEKPVRASNNSTVSRQATGMPGEQEQNVDNTQPHYIFLPLIAGHVANIANANGERPPVQIMVSQVQVNHVGNSPEAPPEANNHTFVADTGGSLDQYLCRDDVPDGRINFTIGVNAPVLNPEWVGTEGFLTPALLAFWGCGVLPRFTPLKLMSLTNKTDNRRCMLLTAQRLECSDPQLQAAATITENACQKPLDC